MKLFEKILVPTDFSHNADRAMHMAVELAKGYGASILLVHVYDVAPYAIPEGLPLYETYQITQLRDVFDKQLSEAKQRAEQAGATQVETELLQGSAYREIVRRAEEGRFGLIVMGTHGRTGLAHMLLGSVAEKVLRHAPCPVLTVPAQSSESPKK